MKKVLVILLLMMTTIGGELFDSNFWDGVEQRREERGRKCYEDYKGNIYCEDKDGNRIP